MDISDIISINEKHTVSHFIWLKYNCNSCRYDSFLLLYLFIIYDVIHKFSIPDNLKEVVNYYDNLVDQLRILNIEELNMGVWSIIDKIQIDWFNFKTEGYKQEYAISQLISLFKNNNIFCFEINRENYCYKCKYTENVAEYLGPIIQINIE